MGGFQRRKAQEGGMGWGSGREAQGGEDYIYIYS